jgi:hypothetical protein
MRIASFCTLLCRAALAITLAFHVNACLAQEVGAIDLVRVKPRTELREPPKTQRPAGAPSGGQLTYRCFDSPKKTGQLRTTLVSLDRTHYQMGDSPIFEVTVENIGFSPLEVPFSPHLSDLQPADPSQKFAYSELRVTLWIGGKHWSANTGGGITLYGATSHPDTMVSLHPGEWVRIVGKGDISLPSDGNVEDFIRRGDAVDHMNARVSLYKAETLLTSTAGGTVTREVCISQDEQQGVPVAVTEGN